MTITPTRTAPVLNGTWSADTVHSELAFKVRHMGVGRAGGTIALSSATLILGERGITTGTVTAIADAGSVETKNAARDEHVRSADFLDVVNHPTIEFRSTGVREFDGETFLLDGTLTVRGVTRPVTLHAEFLGATVDPYGADRVGFAASGSINRKDFGVNFSAVFGVSNSVVSDKVELSIEAEFVKDAA